MHRTQLVLVPTEAETTDQVEGALLQRFADIRRELEVVEDFPSEALAEAEQAALSPASLPTTDLTDLPFFTLDPPGSMDLDQAVHFAREGEGYRVRYAIADVPAFVAPGGPLDLATRSRGQTTYCPDRRIGLHPPVLAEGAASLLPGVVRPAYVWDLCLDAEGVVTSAEVARALIRSEERLDYESVQRALDEGTTEERLLLLREVGELREAQERARGGASLPMPEQQVRRSADGSGFVLEFRPAVPAEGWNAQISLMTGMAAAELMIAGGVGILRTMPPPTASAIARFRTRARALGAPWPEEQSYGAFIAGLDRQDPRHLALIHEATGLFRGAGYTPIDGEVPAEHAHAAVAAPYAHVTAPLRRLVDRFGLVVCEALSAGAPVPQWAREALPLLADLMATSDRRTRAVERACTDATEAAVLHDRVGQDFSAVVVDHTERGMVVQLVELPVLHLATGDRTNLGRGIAVRLTSADIDAGRVTFTYARP